jgi:hypothetical protein
MNGEVQKSVHTNSADTTATMPNSTSVPNIAKLSTLSPTQQQRYRQDWLERENQASALAAAGMVAESVTMNHSSSSNYVTTTLPVVGLQAPPTIGAQHNPPGAPLTNSMVTELDSINWNLMDIGGMNIDDMDMDFATLFDPANELYNVPSPREATSATTASSGWPLPTTPSMNEMGSVSPTPMSHQVWSESVLSGDHSHQSQEDSNR